MWALGSRQHMKYLDGYERGCGLFPVMWHLRPPANGELPSVSARHNQYIQLLLGRPRHIPKVGVVPVSRREALDVVCYLGYT